MPSASYSFLDVAVLDDVRERFASGDALVILSTDLEDVIWANGPGAALFGQPDIEAIIGASARLGFATKRQIAATRGFPDIGRDRAILVRLATGMSSRAMALLASAVTLPDGETAILLAAPAPTGGARSDKDIAERAIGGFVEAGHFVAFVDGQGSIEAASDGFGGLGISAETLAGMVEKVGGEGSRIVKRMIPGRAGPLAAGLARLTDARHLLVVIDEGRSGEEAQTQPDAAPTEATSPMEPDNAVSSAAPTAKDNTTTSAQAESLASPEHEEPPVEAAQAGDEGSYFSAEEGASAEEEMLLEAEAAAEQLQREEPATATEHQQPEAPKAEELEIVEAVSAAEPEAAPEGKADTPVAEQRAEVAAAVPPAGKAATAPEIDRASGPVRFVWRTDAEGRFSHISPEFSRAVGTEAADIVGRRFEDVANVLGLDPAGEIAGLLARRDTWSGRSVHWPIADTDLKIPVDLAALPVYDRARTFEGFRGFGVARTGDAVIDPEGVGLVLVTSAPEAAPDVPDTEAPKDEAANESAEPPADPFRGEVPALTIVPMPERRFTDKVIRLAEHRQPPANDKGLSTGERIAFQQIGERLKKESGVATPEAGETEQVAPQKEDAQPDRAAATVPAETAAANVADVTEAASTDPDETAGDADDVSELLLLDGESGEALESDANSEATAAEAVEEAPLQPVDEAVETSDAHEVTAGTATPATDEVAAESAGETEAAAPARKPGRPGMSLLDFAKWDQDEPAQPVDESFATAAAPAAAEPTAEPAVADAVSAPVALVEMEEAAALDERMPQAAEDAARTGADETVDAAGVDAETPPAAQQVETASEEPGVSRAFIERSRQELTPQRREGDLASPPADLQQKTGTGLSILEKLPVPVLVHSGDTLYYANNEFFALTGYRSVEELSDAGGIGALFADPYEDEDAGDDERGKVDRQLRLKNRDGEEFPVEAFLQSVPWNDGKALLLVLSRAKEGAFATASSGQSPLIAELEARVAEMRTIIDTATDGVVLIARDGAIRSISRPAEALFGFDSDDVTGKPFASLFAIESQRAARDYLNGLSDHGVASVLNDGREVIGRESQGRFIPLFMTIGKLPNDSGYCAVVRDITQWKRAEEELTQARSLAERASSHKTDFLARVSHEIRTPLNAIIGFSELMMDEKFGPVANDRYRDYLRDINRSGNHVLDLVNDLLDISKIEAGQQEMAYEAVSLNDTLSDTVAMMQPQANRERVIIRSSFASKLPDVVADLRSVRQIALNVLSNAVRYTQAGGQVIVSTAYEAGEVVMRVRDTGIGMTQAEIEQALKPFKQINSLKRARGDGTGLGLPLTKAMVEANRAKFSINSTPGEGTLVEISFPSTRVLAD